MCCLLHIQIGDSHHLFVYRDLSISFDLEYDIEDGHIVYYPYFFDKEVSDRYFSRLIEEIKWGQEYINMFGKRIAIPRETAWYGDSEKTYVYSGISNNPIEWTDMLLEIKEEVEKYSPSTFNSLLLNRYRDGQDKVSWHADDEKELDANCSIASVSFGVERTFQLKHKEKGFKEEILLNHGSYRNIFSCSSNCDLSSFSDLV